MYEQSGFARENKQKLSWWPWEIRDTALGCAARYQSTKDRLGRDRDQRGDKGNRSPWEKEKSGRLGEELGEPDM